MKKPKKKKLCPSISWINRGRVESFGVPSS
jgi:hypothetical protein